MADQAAVALSSTIGEKFKQKEEPVLIIKSSTPMPKLLSQVASKTTKSLKSSFLTERFNAIFKQQPVAREIEFHKKIAEAGGVISGKPTKVFSLKVNV